MSRSKSKKQEEDRVVGALPIYESMSLNDVVAAASQLGLELHIVLAPKKGSGIHVASKKAEAAAPAPKRPRRRKQS